MSTTEPFRRPDRQAREVFVEVERDPAGLAAARIGIEHIDHHGQPLQFIGSSYQGDTVSHLFACCGEDCPLILTWSVTS